MLTTIKLHGILKEDFGDSIKIEASSAADAIEGFTRQVNFYGDLLPEVRPVIRVVGFDTQESLYEERELKEIHLVPAMIGGGGFGKILIGAALIALAFVPVIGQVGLVGGMTLGGALLSVGATLVLSGVMQLFMKAPKAGKGTQDPEASKYMALGDNTVAIGTPIAIQYGRGPATGHLLAVNVDSSDMIMGQFPVTPT
jgi:predicted phage tail protein